MNIPFPAGAQEWRKRLAHAYGNRPSIRSLPQSVKAWGNHPRPPKASVSGSWPYRVANPRRIASRSHCDDGTSGSEDLSHPGVWRLLADRVGPDQGHIRPEPSLERSVGSTRGSPWPMSHARCRTVILYCWLQTSGEVVFGSVPWRSAIVVWGSYCLTGLVMTDLLRRRSKRKSWVSLPLPTLVVRLLLSTFAMSLVGVAVMAGASMAAYREPVPAMLEVLYRHVPLWNRIFGEFVNALVIYTTWVAAYFGVATIRYRYEVELTQAKLAEALQAAELGLLESQLNPHFMFNALNGLRALIAEEPTRAQGSRSGYRSFGRSSLPRLRCEFRPCCCRRSLRMPSSTALRRCAREGFCVSALAWQPESS